MTDCIFFKISVSVCLSASLSLSLSPPSHSLDSTDVNLTDLSLRHLENAYWISRYCDRKALKNNDTIEVWKRQNFLKWMHEFLSLSVCLPLSLSLSLSLSPPSHSLDSTDVNLTDLSLRYLENAYWISRYCDRKALKNNDTIEVWKRQNFLKWMHEFSK